MNKLTIKKGDKKYEIMINSYKLIVGLNQNEKFEILRTIIRFYNNYKPSDYALEKNHIPYIFINEKEQKTKDIWCCHVDKYFSLTNDFKLTTKSLVLKYFETLLSSDKFFDTINTLNILFESLSVEISDISEINGFFNSMVPKQLIKILNPRFMNENICKDEFDLTIEELILLQLTMIKYILKNNKTIKSSIITIEIPFLTEDLLNSIKEIENAFVLIFIDSPTELEKNIDYYYICENKQVDLSNEDDLYTLICDNDINLLNLKEGREYMEKYLFDKEHDKAAFIKKLLEKSLF